MPNLILAVATVFAGGMVLVAASAAGIGSTASVLVTGLLVFCDERNFHLRALAAIAKFAQSTHFQALWLKARSEKFRSSVFFLCSLYYCDLQIVNYYSIEKYFIFIFIFIHFA